MYISGTNYLSHLLLSPWVCVSRKLDLWAKLELNPSPTKLIAGSLEIIFEDQWLKEWPLPWAEWMLLGDGGKGVGTEPGTWADLGKRLAPVETVHFRIPSVSFAGSILWDVSCLVCLFTWFVQSHMISEWDREMDWKRQFPRCLSLCHAASSAFWLVFPVDSGLCLILLNLLVFISLLPPPHLPPLCVTWPCWYVMGTLKTLRVFPGWRESGTYHGMGGQLLFVQCTNVCPSEAYLFMLQCF